VVAVAIGAVVTGLDVGVIAGAAEVEAPMVEPGAVVADATDGALPPRHEASSAVVTAPCTRARRDSPRVLERPIIITSFRVPAERFAHRAPGAPPAP
jgi:hypothetical protein